ncbi:MAG: ATP-binding protein [Microbacter sp.]
MVVISGVRRSGKSSLLSIIKNRLQLQEPEFCYLNFDDERITADVTVLSDLYALHLKMYRTEPVFFFDEIQLVEGWEKFVNRMYEQGRKVYVTGSNAKLLSAKISTSLTGRTKVLELFPFSFAEYLLFAGRTYDMQQLSGRQLSLLKNDLKTSLTQGGFPHSRYQTIG